MPYYEYSFQYAMSLKNTNKRAFGVSLTSLRKRADGSTGKNVSRVGNIRSQTQYISYPCLEKNTLYNFHSFSDIEHLYQNIGKTKNNASGS